VPAAAATEVKVSEGEPSCPVVDCSAVDSISAVSPAGGAVCPCSVDEAFLEDAVD
jgi:hypothetical protein